MRIRRCVPLLLAVILLGCSSEQPGLPPSHHIETMKACLETLIDTGEMDGNGVTLLESAGLLKATEPEKGAELEADATELMTLRSPEEIKKKAKEMAAKL